MNNKSEGKLTNPKVKRMIQDNAKPGPSGQAKQSRKILSDGSDEQCQSPLTAKFKTKGISKENYDSKQSK